MNEVIKGVIGGLMIGLVFFTFLELIGYLGRKKLNSDARINKKYLSKPHEGFKS